MIKRAVIESKMVVNPTHPGQSWVDFARSSLTQSTNLLTQSNSIQNECFYSNPHEIQSIVTSSGENTVTCFSEVSSLLLTCA